MRLNPAFLTKNSLRRHPVRGRFAHPALVGRGSSLTRRGGFSLRYSDTFKA
jgi:hypothetical protein